jgi:DNA-binding MurR/RpiR family transcriptional regulator
MIIDKMMTLETLTSQERAVVEYIVKHPKDILEMSINDLAIASYTSASTIVRLCKKLGTRGYADLKFIYASEYPEMMKLAEFLKIEPYNKKSSIDNIIHTLPLVYSKAVDHTRSLLERNTVIRVTNLIKQAKRVEIYGDGANYHLANLMAYRFEGVNKDCFIYNSPHWEHIQMLERDKIPTLAILLSHTGKNPSIIEAAKRLKNSKIPTLSISGNSDKRLAKLTDENIHIMITRNELEFSTTIYSMSTQYILDIFIASLLVRDYDKIKSVANSLSGARERYQNE